VSTTPPARGRAVLVAAALGGTLFLATAALPNVGLFDRDQVGDTPLYRSYGDAVLDGRVPYRDLYVEYPPGALPAFVAAAPGGAGYATRFKLLMCVLGIALTSLVALTAEAAGARPARIVGASAFVGLAPAALGPVFLVNYDLWPAFLTAAALALVVRGRGTIGLVVLAGAVAAKVYPLVLLPLALLHLRVRSGTRAAWTSAAAFAAALAAIVLPFFVLAPGAVGFDLSVAARRPLQIESLGSSFLLAAHQLGLYAPRVDSRYNSQNLGGSLPDTLAVASSAALLLTLAAVWIAFARRPNGPERLLVASAAAVTAAVALGKVLSPQFLIWLVPLVALVPARRLPVPHALLAVALALTHVWFPSRYGDVTGLGAIGWVVLARDLVLVALLATLVVSLAANAEARKAA